MKMVMTEVMLKLYQYSSNEWIQRQTLLGEDGGDNSGISVSLNGDGTISATGVSK